jgi:hypothetical protein
MWFDVAAGRLGFGGLFQAGHGPEPRAAQPL